MLTLEQIPMRQDNYSYAIIHDNDVILIDPSAPHESRQYFKDRPELKLVAIINTHSHNDHVAGNEVLVDDWDVPVFGPDGERERIPRLTHAVKNHDVIEYFGISITAHDVRAHTIGHTAYLVHAPFERIIKHGHQRKPFIADDLAGRKVMFVGDSLFAAGCGRLFEGSREMLKAALSFYGEQPDNLLMACAHEYTKANLAFARSVFVDNSAIEERWSTIDDLLLREGASVPVTFGLEHKTNPFLMALNKPYRGIAAKKYGIDESDLTAIIGALRVAKDNF